MPPVVHYWLLLITLSLIGPNTASAGVCNTTDTVKIQLHWVMQAQFVCTLNLHVYAQFLTRLSFLTERKDFGHGYLYLRVIDVFEGTEIL